MHLGCLMKTVLGNFNGSIEEFVLYDLCACFSFRDIF